MNHQTFALHLELSPLIARRLLWNVVALSFTDPFERETRSALAMDELRTQALAAADLLATESVGEFPLAPGELHPRELSLHALFQAWDTASYEELEAAHRSLFGFTACGRCPAYATAYEENDEVFYRTQRMADLGGFYRAFGLSPTGRSERLDHIAVLADFLHVLLTKECRALLEEEEEKVEVCRDARRKLLTEHVIWWVPAFSNLLHHMASESSIPFYREAARLTAALCAAERRASGLDPVGRAPAPNPMEPHEEDACGSCPLG